MIDNAVKKHFCAFLSIILILSTTACSSKTKEFQTTVDSFVEHYNVAVNTDDMLTEDINLKVAAGDLRELSRIYHETDKREELNDLLDESITKEMIEKVYEYNKESATYKTIEDDIIEYYGITPSSTPSSNYTYTPPRSSPTSHKCEVCGKTATHELEEAGEYYCDEHWEEMEEIINMLLGG